MVLAQRRRVAPAWRRTFVAPLVVVLLLTTVLPILYTVGLSLGPAGGRLQLGRPEGLGTLRQVLGGHAVWHALGLVVVFLIWALAVELTVGVLTALMLDRLLPRNAAVRLLLLAPAVLPPIAVALVFKFLLQGDIGMVSYYLEKVGIHQDWLTHPASAMAVVVLVDVWQYTPFVILLALAALTGVPHEMREAAALDGAGPVSIARYVVLPMIMPAVIAIALLRFIDAVQVFPTIFVLTRGGPGTSTQLLTYFNYQTFFGELQFGQGAAVALVVVAFTIGCVALLLAWQHVSLCLPRSLRSSGARRAMPTLMRWTPLPSANCRRRPPENPRHETWEGYRRRCLSATYRISSSSRPINSGSTRWVAMATSTSRRRCSTGWQQRAPCSSGAMPPAPCAVRLGPA